MSAARDYLAELNRIGARIVPTGDGLRLVPSPGKSIPPDLIARGRALKPELIELLREPSRQNGDTDQSGKVCHTVDDDAPAAFEERAAIAEYDGGLDRTEAELLAAACVVPLATGETAEARQATVLHFAEHLEGLRRRRLLPVAKRADGDAA